MPGIKTGTIAIGTSHVEYGLIITLCYAQFITFDVTVTSTTFDVDSLPSRNLPCYSGADMKLHSEIPESIGIEASLPCTPENNALIQKNLGKLTHLAPGESCTQLMLSYKTEYVLSAFVNALKVNPQYCCHTEPAKTWSQTVQIHLKTTRFNTYSMCMAIATRKDKYTRDSKNMKFKAKFKVSLSLSPAGLEIPLFFQYPKNYMNPDFPDERRGLSRSI